MKNDLIFFFVGGFMFLPMIGMGTDLLPNFSPLEGRVFLGL